MKTRILGLAVVIVAMAVIVNALALSSASISGTTMSIDIVNSGSALVGIGAPASPDSDLTITDNGKLSLTVEHGVQASATYLFDQALQLTNRSDDAIDLTWSMSGLPAGMTINFYNDADGLPVTSPLAISANSAALNLRMEVVTTSGAATAAGNISIQFDAAKQ